ncbi:ABC-type transport system, involved in lipoprotein release, permease component [Thioflavicoccus mobilis 8321]|uniref:ABC-type transport system, involved in lipoprotein release, permease component n=1 Tax=Thioflavicoccus mobilis 8321 TaxID=765912 RepID=L0GUX3_9GAMM|nr:ABC transporter permease [Thioflavicoccus mobilis]AGA89170.1 ABC-type transport system, involved in lipoprotein release, permease component [Thioflavicoccus mobilis 8321]
MSAALRHVFLASLWRRRLATALSLLAIALGVTLGLAVQLINSAALDELGRGMRLLAGEADLQVVGPRGGFDDTVYLRLAQRPEVAQASPVLEIEARLPDHEGETLRIFGIDLFRAARVTPLLRMEVKTPEGAADANPDRLAPLRPDNLFLSPAAAERLGVAVGDRLKVQVGVDEVALHVAGSVPDAGADQALAVMDIAGAQPVFERIGVITRIDLRLVPGVSRAAAQRRLNELLPPGVAVMTQAETEAEVSGLSRAYRVNLTMLAAIALLTGAFLVFSAQWLSVVRRRPELAFLRALGLDRGALHRGLLAEGGTLGLFGGLLGVALAYLLTALAFRVIGGDLGAGFFRGVSPELRFAPVLTGVYLALAVLAGLAGAWLPAREAVQMIPARALRSGDEAEAYRAAPRWRHVAAILGLAGVLCLLPPIGDIPVSGYIAVVLILVGAVLALPGVTPRAMALLGPGRSALGRLARARLAAAPGQVLVAGAGIVASAALAVSMAIMVFSFRGSVDDWLTQLLPADLYLRASDSNTSGYLDPATVSRIAALPGVMRMRPVRFETVRLGESRRAVALIARPVQRSTGLPLVAGTLRPGWAGDGPPPAWISEALADRLGLAVGAPLELPLGGEDDPFRVAGIWRDYARQQGAVVIELDDYRALTGDARTNDLGLFLAEGIEPEAVMATIRETLGERIGEMILPGELRTMILEVFDRTFLVTYLMEAVAVLIGLFGVSTTFAAMATSRRKELGILRHLGLRRRQIGTLLAREAALTAGVGLMVGLLAGGAIALVLIEVINRQSFHWSMDLRLPLGVLVAFGLALVLLSALAARLAGRQAMRQDALLAVREDW